jgi:hypothetical protein
MEWDRKVMEKIGKTSKIFLLIFANGFLFIIYITRENIINKRKE